MRKLLPFFVAIFASITTMQSQVKEASIEFRTCFDTEMTEPAATVATCLSPYIWHNATFDVLDGIHQEKDGYELTAKGCTCFVHMDVTFEDHDETHPTVVDWCDTQGAYEWRAEDNTLLGSYTQSTQQEVAHGTNEYGCPIVYTLDLTVNSCAPEGAISGVFSVSSNKQVYFSRGNLQFCPKPSANPKNFTQLDFNSSFVEQSTTTQRNGQWRLAEHQFDYVGSTVELYSGTTNTGNVPGSTNSRYSGANFSGFYDLVEWGNHAPTSWTNNQRTLYPTIDKNFYDVGYRNTIYYGNNKWSSLREWRTPSAAEMKYLVKDRSGAGWSANNRMAMGTIEGQNGLILLPDAWTKPNGVNFVDYTNAIAMQLSTNIYTASTWQLMEDAGAVFLPCAGYYEGGNSKFHDFNTQGSYWMINLFDTGSSWSHYYVASYFTFNTTNGVEINNLNTPSGRFNAGINGGMLSVRVIQDVK